MVRIMKKDAYQKICFKFGAKIMSKINLQNGPDSETLTSNAIELVDSNFNQLSFIQAVGAEALVRAVDNEIGENFTVVFSKVQNI